MSTRAASPVTVEDIGTAVGERGHSGRFAPTRARAGRSRRVHRARRTEIARFPDPDGNKPAVTEF